MVIIMSECEMGGEHSNWCEVCGAALCLCGMGGEALYLGARGVLQHSVWLWADVGKVILKSNGNEALSDEILLKSNGDEVLNDVFCIKSNGDEAFNAKKKL